MKGNDCGLSRQRPGGFHCLHIQAINRTKTDRQRQRVSAHTTVGESQFLLFPCLSLHTKLLEIHRIDLQHLSPYSGLFLSSTGPLPAPNTFLKLSLVPGQGDKTVTAKSQHIELIQFQKQRLHVTKYLN